MPIAFDCLGVIFALMAASAMALSVCMGVAGCLCPISSNIFLMYTTSLAIIYSAASPASVADVITCLMMWTMLRMAPLLGGILALVDMKKCPTTRLLAFGFWLAQVASIAMDRHDHFTAVVCEYHIFLCGEVIEQLVGT